MGNKVREIFTQALFESIAETQKQSGREVQMMTEDTIPLLDLIGFDSHSGVDAEIHLSIRLGIEIEMLPLRVGKRGSKELTIRQIVTALMSRYGKQFSDMSAQVEESATQ